MAPLIYKPEGEQVAKQVWDETIAEFSFADVQESLREIEK
jgi:hypothetical protein